MTAFRVIIVGGSVAGLTLANILQRYGIDYIVLEKYPTIAPQLGASIGILPYGCQVLDQIGVLDRVREMSMSVDRLQSFGPDGEKVGGQDTFGVVLEELTGYQFEFLDRQQIIQALYDNLEDKSKVVASQELLKIEHLQDSVTVTTKNGHEYTGSILVGADGVHSRTRDEIWRIAESENPTYGAQSMANKMTCTYRCLFGIADQPEGTTEHVGYKKYVRNRSYIYQSGRGGKLYFFAFFKNPQVTKHQSIPKYTAQDEKDAVTEAANDVLLPGVTFADVYEKRRIAVLTPLQEYVLQRCFHKRAILIGDAFHKFNPLTGQGGNSAIEDAALLADLVKKMLMKGSKPTNDQLNSAFSHFERERRPRAEKLMDGARFLQKFDALENPFLEFLNLHVMSKLGVDKFITNFVEICSPSHALRYLPPPSRRGVVALDQDVIARPKDRSPTATKLWSGFMIAMAALFVIGYRCFQPLTTGLEVTSNLSTLSITITINTMWTIESYRSVMLGGPLFR
ncbi:FAD/NAD(P)-binding domain-containing protein [Aspergillus steynii IBT 23096]|uniref:FAD/NAD(P)-binding domain-containing protein n=1 Tax=Aspergillus steynii IBT 23096 TaxID=1392250 RepID=A0A2I2G4C0_9EURO|nr:FAD/NAD(P)-binding domain-containing protein [Aspergillus steynii IBT 23096]PLB47722.1 FAD/NAD(P)-binding domain-containing protein [Aspergillus steynii IBT 23096]